MVNIQEFPLPLTSSRRTVAARLFTPDRPNGSRMLFIHGYKSSQDGYAEYAEQVARAGTTALTFDLGGHGESEGDADGMTISNHMEEARAAYGHLDSLSPTTKRRRIAACGASFGAYLITLLSTQAPMAGMLLRSPALFPDGMDDVPRRNYDTEAINKFRKKPGLNNAALQATLGFGGRLALVSSKDDGSKAGVIRAFDSAAGLRRNGEQTERHILPGSGNSLGPEQRQMFKGIIGNFARTL